MIVKAGKISNLTDARYFAAEEVQYLGFNLEEGSIGYLDPVYMRAIREWVQGPIVVGEFGRTPLHIVKEAANFFTLDVVQITLPDSVDEVADWSGVSIILEIDPAQLSPALLALWQPFISAFLVRIDANTPLESLVQYKQFPIIWSLDAPLTTILSFIARENLYGLELIGGEEEAVGVKSFDQLNEIFEYLSESKH